MNRGIVIVVTASLLLTGIGTARADDKNQARKHFEAGIAMLKVENYAVAATEFERAVDLYPTKTGLFNLASCYHALDRKLKALEILFRLRMEYEDHIDPDMAAAVAAMESEIRAKLATLTVKVNIRGATVKLNGAELGKSPLVEHRLVNSGKHELEVSAPGYTAQKRRIELAAGAKKTAEFKLVRDRSEPLPISTTAAGDTEQPADEAQESADVGERAGDEGLSPLFWVGVAGSAAAGVTAGVLWGVTGSKADDYDSFRSDYLDLDPASPDYADQESSLYSKMKDARDDTQSFNRAAVGVTIVAGALVVGTVAVLAIELSGDEEPTEGDDTVRVIPAPGGVAVTF